MVALNLESVVRHLLRVCFLLAVCLASGPAYGEEKAKPTKYEQAALDAKTAHEGGDADALAQIAAKLDPWLVADLLCHGGQHDAAAALADAAQRSQDKTLRADTRKLPAYIDASRSRERDEAERERFRTLDEKRKTAKRIKEGPEREPLALAIVQGSTSDAAPETVVQIRLRHTRSFALEWLGRHEERQAALSKAGIAARKLGWLRRAEILLRDAGTCAFHDGDRADALASWDAYLDLCEERSKTALLRVLEKYRGLGDPARAARAYERHRIAYRAAKDSLSEAWATDRAGESNALLGKFALALRQHDRARKLYAQLKRRPLDDKKGKKEVLNGEIRALGNMARVHGVRGEYAQAIDLLDLAVGQIEAAGALADPLDAAWIEMLRGNVELRLGHHAAALPHYERALTAMRKHGDTYNPPAILANIGTIHRDQDDHQKAFDAYADGSRQLEKLGDQRGQAQALGNMGVALDAMKRYDEAVTAYEAAWKLKKAVGDEAGAALTLANIGEVHQHKGDYVLARQKLTESAERARSVKGATEQEVAALSMLARLYLEMGDAAKKESDKKAAWTAARSTAETALDRLETLLGGLGDEQGAAARAEFAMVFAVGALAAVREQNASQALTFLESGRAGAFLDLLDNRDALRFEEEGLPEALLREEAEAKEAERKAQQALDEVTDGDREAAEKALREATSRRLKVSGARYQRQLKKLAGLQQYFRAKDIKTIQASLGEDQALVLYGLFHDDGVVHNEKVLDEAIALVLRRDADAARLVPLGKATVILDACAKAERAVRNTKKIKTRGGDTDEDLPSYQERWEEEADRLQRLLIGPLNLAKDVKQVLVSPEGRLCYVPFSTLLNGRTVVMTPSGSTHVLLHGEERGKRGEGVLALGDPVYEGVTKGARSVYYRGQGLPPLPHTRAEAEAVGSTTLLGPQASEAGLREALRGTDRWRAVHFACHGKTIAERPMLSSLALSPSEDDDGFLSALEVMRESIPADLAVLSACETSQGKIVKGEGLVGLTRAFMFAGAPRVICSLWRVDDEATAALMKKFYALWKEGKPTAVALQEAQRSIRDHPNGRWKPPHFWAAWTLWGLGE